ncbi:MAG: transposase [Rhodanobacter sp.]
MVQRGNDRQACFAGKADYLRYLQGLRGASSRHDCAIHAYVLMTNHVHLLVTPATTGAISRMMQAVGRRYVGSFNARYRRTAPCGKDASRQHWSIPTGTCSPAIATSSSIPSGPT